MLRFAKLNWLRISNSIFHDLVYSPTGEYILWVVRRRGDLMATHQAWLSNFDFGKMDYMNILDDEYPSYKF